MNALLAVLLLLQAAPAPSEADKVEAALKKFGDRKYTVLLGGKAAGSLTLKTRVEKEGDRKVAVFDDRGELKIGDEVDGGLVLEKASLDGLRLQSSRTTGLEGTVEVEISVAEGKVMKTVAGKTTTVAAEKGIVGPLSVYRMVCLQEQKVGAAFKIDMLAGTGDMIDHGHAFQCVAREILEIAGAKHDAFKWEQTFETKMKPPVVPLKLRNDFWVSPDGYLLRVVLYDGDKVRNEMVLLQTAPAQSEADKLEAALKKFGDRGYSIIVNGEKVGTCTLKTRIEKDGDRSVAVFEDRSTWHMAGGTSISTEMEKATTDRLHLLSSKWTFEKEGKKESLSAIIRGSKAHLKIEGRDETFDISDSTIGEQSLARLVCSAEQKEGAIFKVDVLDVVGEQFQPGHTLRCLRKELVEIGGKKVNAFKWEDKGEWKLRSPVGERETRRVNYIYWVSPDGYLLRFNNGDLTEWILDAK